MESYRDGEWRSVEREAVSECVGGGSLERRDGERGSERGNEEKLRNE
ncbi:hypothetical protein A2U01_0038751, partial [Trifolium medium]|nr:hypothetical protein [Trifolium medium]